MASNDVDALAALVWEAALPIKCVLADSCRDDSNRGADDSCYFMVPRQGYLGYSLKVVLRSFAHLKELQSGNCNVWFTFSHRSWQSDRVELIPWHYPMCVVVDRLAILLGLPDSTPLLEDAITLTVTFSASGPPAGDEVIPITVSAAEKGVDVRLKQLHKEFLMTRFNTIRPWVAIDAKEYGSLIDAPKSNDPSAFFIGRANLEQQARRDIVKEIYDAGEAIALVILHIDGRAKVIRCDTGRLTTLGLLLREELPCCYDMTEQEVQSIEPIPAKYANVLILGTRPPACVPTRYLRDHLCCADLAVHIVVGCKASNAPRPRPAKAQDADVVSQMAESVRTLSEGSTTLPANSPAGSPLQKEKEETDESPTQPVETPVPEQAAPAAPTDQVAADAPIADTCSTEQPEPVAEATPEVKRHDFSQDKDL
jgi:hypothetical protein